MSSIYRKGRDGYFYYQTYVLCLETGKKTKRIFHSLGTKKQDEAEKKQIEYDLTYEKKRTVFDKRKESTNSKQKLKYLGVVICTVIITLIIVQQKGIKPVFPQHNIQIKKAFDKDIGFKLKQRIENNSEQEIKDSQIKIKESPINNSVSFENRKSLLSKITIPKYFVQRIEHLSGSFEQVKVSLSVDNGFNKKNLILICKEVKKEFNEFSNIIICVYSNTDDGLALIKNQDWKINSNGQKHAWLAMYTYNSVEGEYFDDNPSDYLGFY